jgi:hypothetical protein
MDSLFCRPPMLTKISEMRTRASLEYQRMEYQRTAPPLMSTLPVRRPESLEQLPFSVIHSLIVRPILTKLFGRTAPGSASEYQRMPGNGLGPDHKSWKWIIGVAKLILHYIDAPPRTKMKWQPACWLVLSRLRFSSSNADVVSRT